MLFTDFEFTTDNVKVKGSVVYIKLAIIALTAGLGFSVVQDTIFNLKERKYKIQYSVGPIKVGKWKKLPKIDYVSVFKQPKVDDDFIYETNLWYNRNKHFHIYESFDFESVYEMGESVARVLKVDLLDATIPNDHKWVNLTAISNPNE